MVSRGSPKGHSVHIGLNQVDPTQYKDEDGEPWDGTLLGCVNDARRMQEIAAKEGYMTWLLADEQATSSEVIGIIGRAAKDLTAGDIFLLTYSGHGGQVPDVNSDDEDGKDETWCLFDRMLIDDELFNMWSKFASGVRVLVISDSCHSGTVLKQQIYSQLHKAPRLRAVYESVGMRSRGNESPRYRNLPMSVQQKTYRANKVKYDTLQWSAGTKDSATIGASVLLLAGCQDNQLSADGDENGLFTKTLLEIWNKGFEGNYQSFAAAIADKMPGTQTPHYYKAGTLDPAFEAQKPFMIGQSASGGASDTAPVVRQPVITAVAESFERGGVAPSFQVESGENTYFVFEVTSNYDLFTERPEENTREFFATYYDDNSPPRLTGSSYTLPDYAWETLQDNDKLYFRIGTTSTDSSWEGYTLSTDDGEEPPSFAITSSDQQGEDGSDTSPSGSKPVVTAVNKSVERGGAAPSFRVETGPNSYYVFEITSKGDLFTNPPEENTDEFYANYNDDDSPPRLTGSSYTLPDDAWEVLQEHDKLYFRIGTTSTDSGWEDYTLSTDDGEEPPSFEITSSEDEAPPKIRKGAKAKSRGTARTPPKSREAQSSIWINSSRTPEEAVATARKSRQVQK